MGCFQMKEPEIDTRSTVRNYIDSAVRYVRWFNKQKPEPQSKLCIGDHCFAAKIVELEEKLEKERRFDCPFDDLGGSGFEVDECSYFKEKADSCKFKEDGRCFCQRRINFLKKGE